MPQCPLSLPPFWNVLFKARLTSRGGFYHPAEPCLSEPEKGWDSHRKNTWKLSLINRLPHEVATSSVDQHVSNACRILLFGFVSYRVYYLGISKHKAPISLRQLTDVNEKLVCLKNFRFVAEIDLRHLGPFGIFDLLKYDKNVSRKLVVERTIYIPLLCARFEPWLRRYGCILKERISCGCISSRKTILEETRQKNKNELSFSTTSLWFRF